MQQPASRIFEPPPALPRGPHGLTREQVAQSQRGRLTAALTELLAQRGYAGVTIGELARRAGVSRAAFYEHFADKEECLLAAYDLFAARALEAITTRIGEGGTWTEFVRAALTGYLELLDDEPVAARAFIVEMEAAGPAARERRRAAVHAFAALIAERHQAIRREDPSLGPLPATAYATLVLGVRELVHDILEEGHRERLVDRVPDLVVLFRAVVAGAAGAQAG